MYFPLGVDIKVYVDVDDDSGGWVSDGRRSPPPPPCTRSRACALYVQPREAAENPLAQLSSTTTILLTLTH